MPRLMFRRAVRKRRDFAMPESAASVTVAARPPGNFRHRQDRFRALQKVAFMRRGFYFSCRDGCQNVCIVPNGQATTQDLQPIHFCD